MVFKREWRFKWGAQKVEIPRNQGECNRFFEFRGFGGGFEGGV